MTINNQSSWLGEKQIKLIEKKYDAQYVCELPIKTADGGWVNFPCAIFYTEEKHPDGSNYMALYKNPLDNRMYVCDGASAVRETFVGAVADNGEIIYSRYRHDSRMSEDGSVMIDGGKDYVHTTAKQLVSIKVVQGHLEIIGR